MWQHVLSIGLVAAAAGISAALSANGPAEDGIETPMYAEGYSSSAPDMPMDLRFRMFTIYSKPCEGLRVPVRLVAEPETVTLKLGQRFQLQDVVLRAYDESGAFLAKQPVGSSLEYSRSVVKFESDNDRSFVITARAPGKANAFFASVCATSRPQARISFIVE